MAQTTSFETVMKNYMLNQWTNLTLEVKALASGNVIDSKAITFDAASGGSLGLFESVTLTIPSDTTITTILVAVGADTHLSFPLGTDEIYFEHGGDLIITQCNVEIGN